ncbi:MAG: hypothetical protein OHK0029_39260 [Armatimonadaceae bacterium]
MHRGFTVTGILLFATVSAAWAQEEEIPFSTERPGFTAGTGIVPSGYLQLEYGYRYSRDQGETEHQIGESGQLRRGLAENIEVRLGLPPFLFLRSSGINREGFASPSLSGKYRFFQSPNQRYSAALIAGTTLPSGASDTGTAFWQPYATLETSTLFGDAVELQANAAYFSAGGRGRRFDQWAFAANLGYTIDDRWGSFLEVYRFVTGADIPQATYMDGGFTYRPTERSQWDINGGIGISSEVRNDYFLSFGYARLF